MTKFKIRTRLLLALAIPLLALGGLGVRYLTTINEVKVDGRLYDQVTGPRAVVADVARVVLARFDDHVGHYETAFETS